jgi:hypothetical protein
VIQTQGINASRKRSSQIKIPAVLKIRAIPYTVPEIVAANISNDAQGLLAIVRYNRLLEVFCGIPCFHLKSHVRRHASGHGQMELDDVYVGVDENARQYVIPVAAKDEGEILSTRDAVALLQLAQTEYPGLICRPIAVVRESENVISCVEFENKSESSEVTVIGMRKYQLVQEII